MKIFYSASTAGFYNDRLHGAAMPADCVAITAARHEQLLQMQADGHVITADADGRPQARHPHATIEVRRAVAMRAIKREALRRIEKAVPAWRQMNDNADLAIAAVKKTDAAAPGLAEPMARRREIDRLRERSNALEARLASMTADALRGFDLRSDEHWKA